MRDCCPANQFDGCCADGECRSATVPIIHLTENHDDRRVRDALVEAAFTRSLAVLSVAAIFLSAIFVGLPEAQRWEKRNQEMVDVTRR